MNNNVSVSILKKLLQKGIISELYRKDVISFYQFDNIIKKLDDDVLKLDDKLNSTDCMENMIIKVFI